MVNTLTTEVTLKVVLMCLSVKCTRMGRWVRFWTKQHRETFLNTYITWLC